MEGDPNLGGVAVCVSVLGDRSVHSCEIASVGIAQWKKDDEFMGRRILLLADAIRGAEKLFPRTIDVIVGRARPRDDRNGIVIP